MIVESLKSHKDIVSDKAARKEGTLRVRNYIRKNQSQTINLNLSCNVPVKVKKKEKKDQILWSHVPHLPICSPLHILTKYLPHTLASHLSTSHFALFYFLFTQHSSFTLSSSPTDTLHTTISTIFFRQGHQKILSNL